MDLFTNTLSEIAFIILADAESTQIFLEDDTLGNAFDSEDEKHLKCFISAADALKYIEKKPEVFGKIMKTKDCIAYGGGDIHFTRVETDRPGIFSIMTYNDYNRL